MTLNVRALAALIVAQAWMTLGAVPLSSAAHSKPFPKACFRALRRQAKRHPQHLTTPPPVALTSTLEVLRRPATLADSMSPAALQGIGPAQYSALWLGSARLLATGSDNTRYYLIAGVYSPLATPRACLRPLSPERRRRLAKLRPPQLGPVVVIEPYSRESSGGIPFPPAWIDAGKAHLLGPVAGSLREDSFFG